MKHLQGYFKSLMLLCMMVVSVAVNAQQVRYVLTKTIQDNVERPQDGTSQIFLTFSGNTVIVRHGSQNASMSFPYQYHHRDGSNSVYYQVATDIINGRQSLNENSLLVLSPDRSRVNMIMYFQGRPSISVYVQKKADSYEHMY